MYGKSTTSIRLSQCFSLGVSNQIYLLYHFPPIIEIEPARGTLPVLPPAAPPQGGTTGQGKATSCMPDIGAGEEEDKNGRSRLLALALLLLLSHSLFEHSLQGGI